ncbi:hypothetical protein C7974DRAFT_404097 [Boeremia exigua]|uniref:uncharacterized protein n=1 Tax=Boeremia exigua TaxID=749465 RepID=UPI001E8E2B3F|nr:uncharacterized protein C7974DRAFT_404097 [Boeremia exigua]KAH6613939.1 hypothetical protein C7974DRAFT_404097 [Boeremia exigua]
MLSSRTIFRVLHRPASYCSRLDSTCSCFPAAVVRIISRPASTMSAHRSANINAEPGKADNGALKRTTSSSPSPFEKPNLTPKNEHRHMDCTHVPSGGLEMAEKQDDTSLSLQLTYRKGDMFGDVPKGCVLIHACNTQGHWGAGIAKAFKQQYPKAYAEHHRFCAKEHTKSHPVPTGTAQLLTPQDGAEQHWIGCLFTSAKYGKAKDKPDMILRNTGRSMQMLLELISQVDKEISQVRMCKINSGSFGVPWEQTEAVLKGIALEPHWRIKIEVWEPEE